MFGLTPFRRERNEAIDLFGDMERNITHSFWGGSFNFKTDIVDKGDKFHMEAELPGFNKEDIDIEIDGNRLTISAKHGENTVEDGNNFVRRERRFGSFVRSFDISDVNTDNIGADYKNGLLTITLPKKTKTEPRGRKIELN
ncbi:MAG TPA: Hsp20/alpha crystallin family protein [Clostridia bacterium]|nr:Hsp20/alpha crystallin family protein [Clostridia bacterium]